MCKIPVIDLSATGQNIARLRIESGLSVKDLQDILGFANPQAIYKWQNGLCLPTLDNLVILAAALGVSLDEIIVYRQDACA
ncbi:MAG: helix-turn-helix transcriptional regulator [Firmicutes bacterium]|nr:helix-turn-helix transcriptional regulator [Bacillota bacterium]